MRHLKKFESKSDSFLSESDLKEVLLEFTDIDLTYTIKKKSFVVYVQEGDVCFMPIGANGNGDWSNLKKDTEKDYVRGYQISFPEFYTDGYFASDVQRGDNQRVFGLPSEKLYKFFQLVKEVQYTIESMDHIFLLSTHKNAEFDFMIIENKN